MTRYLRKAFVLMGRQLAILAAAIAVFSLVLGGVTWAAARAALSRSEVTAKPPVVELKNDRMTVVRMDFAVDGRATRPCYFTYHEDSANWRLEC